MKVAGAKSKDTCGNAQLCAGLEAGIEGTVHTTRTLFAERDNEEGYVLLLVNTAYMLNAGNHIICLWTVRHRWPSDARFIMNCYRHQSLLMVCINDGYNGHWLVSQESVT